MSLRVYGSICTTTSYDGLGGQTLSNAAGVVGESGSGARFAALTARLRCQEVELPARYTKETQKGNRCVTEPPSSRSSLQPQCCRPTVQPPRASRVASHRRGGSIVAHNG